MRSLIDEVTEAGLWAVAIDLESERILVNTYSNGNNARIAAAELMNMGLTSLVYPAEKI